MATGRLPKGAGLRPKARSERLIVQELPDELLIYDLDRHEAFCLNRTASLVWRNCNGRRSVDQLAAIVEPKAPPPADETLVWLALDRLGRARLLEKATSPEPLLRRRELLRSLRLLGLAAAAPLVVSIVAPVAAAAASLGCTGSPNCPAGTPRCTRCNGLFGPCTQFCSGGSGPSACLPFLIPSCPP
jgi:hypothetical protein